MPPPYNINETSPAPSSLISSFPADEQSNRAVIEDWLSFISDPATGQIRAEVLPPAGSAEVPSGSKMLFVQTSAPTGWTKDTTHNNKALRIVNGTAGSGGSASFTAAFTSQTPAGTLSSTTSTGTNSATTDTGTVGGTAITTAQMPSHAHSATLSVTGGTDAQGAHTHSITGSTIDGGGNPARGGGINNITLDNAAASAGNHAHNVSGTASGTTAAAGSGQTHTHSLTMNAHTHTITMNSHTHTFTGTAIDLAVAYVDVIICTRN